MASPYQTLTTLQPQLDEFFEFAYDTSEFIGPRAFPVIGVSAQKGTFPIRPLAEILKGQEDLRRAPDGSYKRDTSQFGEGTYDTDEHGLEDQVFDTLRAMYADAVAADTFSVDRLVNRLLTAAEIRVASSLFNATIYNGARLTTAITTAWDQPSSTPRADVNAARQIVYENTGLWANALIISRQLFHSLRLNTDITDNISSQGAGDQTRASDVTVQQLQEVFGLDNVLVAGGSVRTATAAGPPTPVPPTGALVQQIWDPTMAQVCRIATTGDMQEPCIGRTFHWAGDGSTMQGTVDQYREDQTRSDVNRVRHQTDEVRLLTNAGHLLTAVGT